MERARRAMLLIALVGVLALWASPALAVVDHFDVFVDMEGMVVDGGGTGYPVPVADGIWYEYPNTGWWNMWFYNDPILFDHRKDVLMTFQVIPLEPGLPSFVEVTYNWATPEWQDPSMPPLPEMVVDPVMEDIMIQRLEPSVLLTDVPENGFPFEDFRRLPIPYNPEWVSVDIRGYNFALLGGMIDHECVPIPEPASLTLLALGAVLAGVGVRVRRKK